MENIATQKPATRPGLLTRLWLRLRNVFVYGFDRLLDGAEKGKPQQRNDYVGNAEWVIHESQARGARVLLWTSLLAVALLLLWAGFGSIDEVVRGEGKVVPSRQVQIIQSLDGGIVEEILVKPGQEVEAGQILLKIDSTRFASSLTELHQGSKVPAGSDVVTASGATVALQVENGMPIVIGEGRQVAMNGDVSGALPDPTEAAVTPPKGTDSERLLAALQSGQDPFEVLDPTAAVVSGGPGDDGGGSFVRLARILETTSPLDLAYPNPNRGLDTLNLLGGSGGGGAGGAGNTNNAPIAVNDTARGDEKTTIRGNLLANDSDPDGDPLSIVSIICCSITPAASRSPARMAAPSSCSRTAATCSCRAPASSTCPKARPPPPRFPTSSPTPAAPPRLPPWK